MVIIFLCIRGRSIVIIKLLSYSDSATYDFVVMILNIVISLVLDQ